MRWHETLIPSLRDDPQEAEIASHKLMLRAGLIRRLGGGLYSFLPLGLRALRKVERIVREEMDRAGALEVLMPALHPREVWDRTGRYDLMGNAMFRVKDRQDREMVLGPTHEEIITDLVSREINSYRQLPKTFYQIQTKFRDEIRPRFGLMRAKEFIMKDAYSFDVGWEQADKSYQAMYDAYKRIFNRCGLRTKIVEADTGAMGGNWSHEFMVLADAGEDGLVECEKCAYAANMEKAERSFSDTPIAFGDVSKTAVEISTPDVRTIEQVAAFLKCKPARLIKTLIYMIDGKPMAILVPGDRELNDKKLVRLLEATSVELADDATIVKATGAPVGFAGPVGLNIPIIADKSLRGAAGVITGGNKADTHMVNVSMDRDVKVTAFHDICIVKAGDICPKCSEKLTEKRGIEVGHVFKLGTKYTKAFNAIYLDDQGKTELIVMGCYGIGVTRTLQSVIEQSHDANGIVWPVSVAPYTVSLLVLNPKHEESVKIGDQLAKSMDGMNVDYLIDDRDERPGVKFKDADLLGMPIRVVVSERSLATGCVEIKLRTNKDAELVPVEKAAGRIGELIAAGTTAA